MKLLAIKKVIFEVNYSDFERFIRDEFGVKDYSFVADIECGNDSDHSYRVDSMEYLDEYDIERLEKFKDKGEGGFLAKTLLQDLVNRERIEPGNYLIRVSW